MSCFYHPNRQATVFCNTCGKILCSECGGAFQPPTCLDCVQRHVSKVKSEMLISIAISIVLMIVGCVLSESPMGILLAGIPYGWCILNSITPRMFLWMSWFGWIIYYLIKFILAFGIGIVALPIKIIMWISELKRVKKLQKSVNKKIILK